MDPKALLWNHTPPPARQPKPGEFLFEFHVQRTAIDAISTEGVQRLEVALAAQGAGDGELSVVIGFTSAIPRSPSHSSPRLSCARAAWESSSPSCLRTHAAIRSDDKHACHLVGEGSAMQPLCRGIEKDHVLILPD
jgi:hypothetical protein